MKEYIYEPIHTVVQEWDEGRVLIFLTETGQTFGQSQAQAFWLRDQLRSIAERVKKKLRVIVDLGTLDQTLLTDDLRHLYRDMMTDGCTEKIALVGDTFLFGRVLSILTLLAKPRQKVKYFFKINDAKDWLEW